MHASLAFGGLTKVSSVIELLIKGRSRQGHVNTIRYGRQVLNSGDFYDRERKADRDRWTDIARTVWTGLDCRFLAVHML